MNAQGISSREHQDNANIHRQTFPEPVSEECQIYTDYNGYHRHHVERDSYLSAHLSTLGFWRRPTGTEICCTPGLVLCLRKFAPIFGKH